MLDYKIKIGLAPVRRISVGRTPGGMFSQEAAADVKNAVMPYIKQHFATDKVEFIDLDWFNDEGLMWDYDQAFPIADRFIAEKIDGLFVLNVNFGEEEVGAKLAQLCKVPTLIWAPQDTYFGTDGLRLTDAQCGLFATSKLMQRMGITFSHIVNSPVDSKKFKDGLEDFFALTCMLKNWKKMRILQLGNRPKPFTSMIFNESELMEKFGVEVFPVTSAVIVQRFWDVLKNKRKEVADGVAYIKSHYKDLCGATEEVLEKTAAMAQVYRDLFDDFNPSFISSECAAMTMGILGFSPCLSMSMVNSEKKFVSCESDMLGGITMCLLSCATMGEKYPFFGEFTARHPENENAELIWHCGPFAYQTAGLDLRDTYLNMDGNRIRAGFEVARGDYTIARLDTVGGEYSMLMGNFKGVDGPFTLGNYVWGEFKNWDVWEQATIFGPYVHHMAEVETDVVRRLKEFCRYTGITVDAPDDRC